MQQTSEDVKKGQAKKIRQCGGTTNCYAIM